MTDFIAGIKRLNSHNVHIKDELKTNQLIDNIIKGGKDCLQAVFDFDRTITKHHENGKVHLSSFGMFSRCQSVPERYLKLEKEMMDYYFPLECSSDISDSEKLKVMEEWWKKSEEAMSGLSVSQDELMDVAKKEGPSLRDGTRELFEDLNDANVPVLVFSAGLGDAVEVVLKHCSVMYPNVKIISNFINYDGNGMILGFKGKPIHVMNKNEYALKGTEYYEKILDRDNVILMGDALGDASMADGVLHASNVLKIGFLYDHSASSLDAYMNAFDIVLEDDPTMDVVRAILRYVLQ